VRQERSGLNERLLYSLLGKLKRYGIRPECLARISCSSELECIISALKQCKNLKLVQIAVDPGATVGIVVLVDTVTVWSWEGSSEEASNTLAELVKVVRPDRVVTSEAGVELLPMGDYEIIVVNEHGTSKKKLRGLGRHASSAFLMATRNAISRRRSAR